MESALSTLLEKENSFALFQLEGGGGHMYDCADHYHISHLDLDVHLINE